MPTVPVTVAPAVDPAGRPGVLLQLPDGWVVLQPADARELAAMLHATADEVDAAAN